LPTLNFKIFRLARIRLQFETPGVDAYSCTYIYLYTFYRIFIWVLYLLGREKECVCIYLLSLYSSHCLFSYYYYAVNEPSFPPHSQRSESGSFPGIG
jgi:hypothetical protein